MIGPESAPESKAGGVSSNVLWGTSAAALIAAAMGIAMEATRRRKEAEARAREEMERRNAQAEAREAAERQRLAALMAARQEAARRLEEFEAVRQAMEERRQEALAAREKAEQYQETMAAAQEMAEQTHKALGVVAAAVAAATAKASLSEAQRRYRERNLGLQEPTPVELTSAGAFSDGADSAGQDSGVSGAKSTAIYGETISDSTGPGLMPVPSFWSSPGGWFQARLINAGRQDETTRRVLTAVLAPAADSLKSIADEHRNPRMATLNQSFWKGVEVEA